MGWSLDYKFSREPEKFWKFFATVGRALYIADEFERKCRYLLRIAKLADHYGKNQHESHDWDLTQVLKDKMLRQTIRELSGFRGFGVDDISILERATVARNYVAHESAALGPLSQVREEDIADNLDKLWAEVQELAHGDNIVSRWVYEISEKMPAPGGIQSTYVQRVSEWVFADVVTPNNALERPDEK